MNVLHQGRLIRFLQGPVTRVILASEYDVEDVRVNRGVYQQVKQKDSERLMSDDHLPKTSSMRHRRSSAIAKGLEHHIDSKGGRRISTNLGFTAAKDQWTHCDAWLRVIHVAYVRWIGFECNPYASPQTCFSAVNGTLLLRKRTYHQQLLRRSTLSSTY